MTMLCGRHVRKRGREVAYIAQSSTFETLFKRKPHRFELHPFKDDSTPAIGDERKRQS